MSIRFLVRRGLACPRKKKAGQLKKTESRVLSPSYTGLPITQALTDPFWHTISAVWPTYWWSWYWNDYYRCLFRRMKEITSLRREEIRCLCPKLAIDLDRIHDRKAKSDWICTSLLSEAFARNDNWLLAFFFRWTFQESINCALSHNIEWNPFSILCCAYNPRGRTCWKLGFLLTVTT